MIDEKVAEECTILKILAGSHVHGLNTDSSDFDEEAIIIEPLDQAIGLEKPFEELIRESLECDIKYVSLRKWCHLALKGNPNFLLPLFAPQASIIKMDARGSQLRDMASLFISKLAIKSHLGYMQGQRNRMMNQVKRDEPAQRVGRNGGHGRPRPDLIEKYGFDVKFAMHLLRLGMQGVELVTTGNLVLPLDKDRRVMLMKVRNGEMGLEWVLKMADDLEQEMKDLVGNCQLPDVPNYAEVERWMMIAYFRKWSADQKTADIRDDATRSAVRRGNLYGGPMIVRDK